MVQFSHPYMTAGKITALTLWTFVSKVMSLLSNILSNFVITFIPKSKHLFISWLQSPSVVILNPKKIKSVTASTFSLSICHEVLGPDALILVFLCWVSSQFYHTPPWTLGSLLWALHACLFNVFQKCVRGSLERQVNKLLGEIKSQVYLYLSQDPWNFYVSALIMVFSL